MSGQEENQPTRSRVRRHRHLGGILALALVMALLTPLAVQAETTAGELKSLTPLGEVEIPEEVNLLGQKGKWTEFESPHARVYGNGTQGFVVVAGGSIHDVCMGNVPPIAKGRFRQHWDGSWEVRTLRGGVELVAYVYKTDLDVFAFFDASCGGFFEDGIPLPDPFAHGPVVLRDREWNIAAPFSMEQLPGRYKNSIHGTVKGADGKAYWVRALADYEVTSSGEYVFFKDTLKVRKLGK